MLIALKFTVHPLTLFYAEIFLSLLLVPLESSKSVTELNPSDAN